MNQESPQIKNFRSRLQKLGGDFICNTSLPDNFAYVIFLGPFHGQTVLWQMTLATLQYYCANDLNQASKKSATRPFIKILEGHKGVHVLEVVLDLEIIDEPVIKKAIIMMRNYKRLKIGKIDFGRNIA